MLSVEYQIQEIERVDAELVVVGFALGDRPLRHSAGRTDWRLCGRLWNLIASKRLVGELGEAALLTVDGGLRAPLLLALGLGSRAALDVDTWGKLGQDVAIRVLDLRVKRVVVGLASDAADLGSKAVLSFVCGAASVASARAEDLGFVFAGEGAAARFSALQSVSKNQLPPEADFRLLTPHIPNGGSAASLSV
jgi:hypothetical protein